LIGECFGVRQNDKWGVCDKNGREIIAPKYDNVFKSILGNYFDVTLNGKKGACDLNGRECITPEYESLIYSLDVFKYKNELGKWIELDISLDENGNAYYSYIGTYNKYFEEGDEYFEKRNYKKAAKSYAKALEYKQTASAYYNVAVSYYNQDKYEEAITYFQYCLNNNPGELENKALDLINKSRQYIAQNEVRRQEIAAAIIGGAIAFTAGVVSAKTGVNNPTTNGNMDYLLDPNLAWQQAQLEVAQQQQFMNNMAQQTWNQAQQEVAQQQQFMNNMAQQTWKEAGEKVERERQQLYNQIKNTKKWDGTEFTEAEIMEIMNNIYNEQLETTKQTNNSSSDESEYKGKLSPNQYVEAYYRYEKGVKSWFDNLTTNGVKTQDDQGNIKGTTVGTMPGGTYTTSKMGMREMQKEMRRIRLEAEQYGVHIQESKWETATAGY
jgi:tetratricopeptide (TPR) repeat protein